MLRYILVDIEGTTTPITFVHDVLFPYSARHLTEYLKAHADDHLVKEALDSVCQTVKLETGREISTAQTAPQLLAWISQDRKHPALKAIQGLIWEHGYREKVYTSEVYPDVLPALRAWSGRGLKIGIYSSGSVKAQQLLFEHTNMGDLRPHLSNYFDTTTGPKRESASYIRIAEELGLATANILFLSDIAAELVAAQAAGMQTVQIVRPSTVAAAEQKHAADFTEVEALLKQLPGGCA